MVSVVIGFGAMVAVLGLIAAAPRLGRWRVGGALVGMIIGFLTGVVFNVAIGLLHWFAATDIPNPVIQIGEVATPIATFYPMILACVGFVVGLTARRH